jgi:hypothetical protein
MTELTKPIGDLVVKALTVASSTLNILVDPAQEEPLTEKGTQLVDVFSRLIAGVAKIIGRILAFAH